MAEIIDFNRIRIDWAVHIEADREPEQYNIVRIDEGWLLVSVFCRSWDQVDRLRSQAEQEIRGRGFLRDKMGLM